MIYVDEKGKKLAKEEKEAKEKQEIEKLKRQAVASPGLKKGR